MHFINLFIIQPPCEIVLTNIITHILQVRKVKYGIRLSKVTQQIHSSTWTQTQVVWLHSLCSNHCYTVCEF